MPKPQRDKDFPIFSPAGQPSSKKKELSRSATCPANEESREASNPELSSLATMEQILSEVKSVSSRVGEMDTSVGNRLDAIEGALSEIKTSVTTVESSLSSLCGRVTDLEKRMEETEARLSTSEDDYNKFSTHLASMEKTVEQLRTKVDDLENRGRRKNLRIVGLPERAENGASLSDFLQTQLPTLVGLPADFPPLEIERAHRALTSSPGPNNPPRSVLVRFLRFPQREAVLRAALKKRDILYDGSQLRFYPDLSAEVLRRRKEFDAVGKTMARRNMYRGFAYPARLRCLHDGRIRFFDTPESAAVFLDTLK